MKTRRSQSSSLREIVAHIKAIVWPFLLHGRMDLRRCKPNGLDHLISDLRGPQPVEAWEMDQIDMTDRGVSRLALGPGTLE
jgi:hypothetical protein